MAQSSGPSITEILLLGGAAYLAYTWFTTPAAAAAAPAGGTSTPPCPSPGVLTNNVCTCPAPNTMVSGVCTAPPVYVPPTLTQQLQSLAGAGVTMLNADQWNYYLTQPSPQGLAQPGSSNFTSIFFPNGRPPAGTAEQTMTAAQFVNAIGNPGLSGYQGYKRAIPVPPMYARGMGRITLGDLRNAGRF
jgi:hypothetical protein